MISWISLLLFHTKSRSVTTYKPVLSLSMQMNFDGHSLFLSSVSIGCFGMGLMLLSPPQGGGHLPTQQPLEDKMPACRQINNKQTFSKGVPYLIFCIPIINTCTYCFYYYIRIFFSFFLLILEIMNILAVFSYDQYKLKL